MKIKILKSVVACIISVVATSFMSSVYADAYVFGYAPNFNAVGSSMNKLLVFSGDPIPSDDSFNNAAQLFPMKEGNALLLPGTIKRPGVFKLQKSKNGKYNGPRVDLVLESEKKALDFCGALLKAMRPGMPKFFILNSFVVGDDYRKSGNGNQVVAVAYSIAYDTYSRQVEDGSSTTLKYAFCPNQWGWEPNPSEAGDENKVTGIVSSQLNAANTEYTVTCMPASGKKTITFKRVDAAGISSWVNTEAHQAILVNPENLTSLFQFNKLIGAQYCPMSKSE